MSDGSAVETAAVGWEGMVGLAGFLGTDRTTAQAFCQIRGDALRSILNRYTHAHFTQVAQASACKRLHTMRQRCARWLLETHDRVHRDTFPLTQELLAQMLGVTRPSVTVAARTLQQAGLIRYRRGEITVLDRDGLEEAACECYQSTREAYERLIAPE